MQRDGMSEAELIALIEDESTSDERIEAFFEFDEESLPEGAPEGAPEALIDIPNLSTANQGIMGAFNRRARKKRTKRFLKRHQAGFDGLTIVSEGDSWFQYPVKLRDVIDHLSERPEWNILSLGFAGDWLSNIRLREEYLGAIETYEPRIFLISGGGNDMVGKQRLKWLLRMFVPGQTADYYLGPAFDTAIDQLEELYDGLYSELAERFPHLWIIGHGYDWPTPADGDWLGKPMEALGIRDGELQRQVAGLLIDRFNEMRLRLADRYERVRQIDNRGLVGEWYDELHPTSGEFGRVAERFAAEIDRIVG